MIKTFIKPRESTNQSTKAEVDDCGEVVTRRRKPENDAEQAADNIRTLLQKVAGGCMIKAYPLSCFPAPECLSCGRSHPAEALQRSRAARKLAPVHYTKAV
jgi:hypothetical protein